jgi:general secretion pathway protein D
MTGSRIMLMAALLALATPVALAQQFINLRDADIRAFIQDAARVTGRTIIIDPRVQGKVSVVSERPLSRGQYFEMFLATLRANGFVAVPTASGALRVQPLDSAATTAAAPGGGANAFVTELLPVRSIDPQAAAETLRPLISREGQLTPSRQGRALVIVDFADNIRRVRQLLAQIDRDTSQIRLVPLTNAGAREVTDALTRLTGAANRDGPGGARVVAVDSANAIALSGDPAAVDRLARLAADLDRRSGAAGEVRVLFLDHANAEQVLPVLQQLSGQGGAGPGPRTSRIGRGSTARTLPTVRPTGGTLAGNTRITTSGDGGGAAEVVAATGPVGASSGQPGAGVLKGDVVITRFEGANALVIAGPPEAQRLIGEVVRQLDRRRAQVLVEAIIVEISDNAAKRLGVQWLLSGTKDSALPFGVTNYSNAAPNLLALTGAVTGDALFPEGSEALETLRNAAVRSLLALTGGSFGFAGQSGDAIFGFVINAVERDTASNLLSTPSVMTLDNEEARILVGQEIPITTGEALSPNFDNAFRTVQRQNVGIQLEVRPQINAGGAINLTLRQEVSAIIGPVNDDATDLILSKREIETTITVDDGQIVALGGLLDDAERRTIEKVPFLGDLPVLGSLFRSKSRTRDKTNLMIFIRPTIVRTADDAQRVAAQRWDYARADQVLRDPVREEPMLDELLRDYLRTQAPQWAPPPGTVPPPSAASTAPPLVTGGSSTTVVRPAGAPPRP